MLVLHLKRPKQMMWCGDLTCHRWDQMRDQQGLLDWQRKESEQQREESRCIKRLRCVWGEPWDGRSQLLTAYSTLSRPLSPLDSWRVQKHTHTNAHYILKKETGKFSHHIKLKSLWKVVYNKYLQAQKRNKKTQTLVLLCISEYDWCVDALVSTSDSKA